MSTLLDKVQPMIAHHPTIASTVGHTDTAHLKYVRNHFWNANVKILADEIFNFPGISYTKA